MIVQLKELGAKEWKGTLPAKVQETLQNQWDSWSDYDRIDQEVLCVEWGLNRIFYVCIQWANHDCDSNWNWEPWGSWRHVRA